MHSQAIIAPPHGKTNKLIRAFVFATRIVQFLFYLNPKFQASSSFLCLYRSVCVGPVRKPHCLFSHETAHFCLVDSMLITKRKTYQIHRHFITSMDIHVTCFQEKSRQDLFLVRRINKTFLKPLELVHFL